MMWHLRQNASRIRHTDSSTLLTQMSPYLPDMLSRCRRIEDEDGVLSLVPSGEPAGTRTQGPRLKRAMLYRLSYRLTEE